MASGLTTSSERAAEAARLRGLRMVAGTKDSNMTKEAREVAVPKWVPAGLREDYQIIAIEDGEEAAASYARRKKSGSVKGSDRVGRDAQIPEPNLKLTREAYLAAMAELEPKEHSVRSILRIVAVVTGHTISELLSIQKSAPISKARHIGVYIAARSGPWSLSQIAKQVGGRDHTTILYAKRRVSEVMEAHGFEWSDDAVDMAQRLWDADWARTAR